METAIYELLILYGNENYISALERRIELYITPLRTYLKQTKEIEHLLFGLELSYAFCMFEDKVIDDKDCNFKVRAQALYFNALYVNWISCYGVDAVKGFNDSIFEFLKYTKTERSNYTDFCYDFSNYYIKEMPIIYHIDLMKKILSEEYEDYLRFVKSYYLAVLIADDIEDFEEDVAANRNTIVTVRFKNRGINPHEIKVKSRFYWEVIDEEYSMFFLALINEYKNFSNDEMYKSLFSIYRNIKIKISK